MEVGIVTNARAGSREGNAAALDIEMQAKIIVPQFQARIVASVTQGFHLGALTCVLMRMLSKRDVVI